MMARRRKVPTTVARVLHDYLLASNIHPRAPRAVLLGDEAVKLGWSPMSSPCDACETITEAILEANEREQERAR